MFEKLITKIAKALDKASLPYMVIGGQAVLLYGEPRLTRDIDITLGISVDQLNRLLVLLPKAGLKPLVEPNKFTKQTMVLPCQESKTGIRVDFIFSFSPYEKEALARVKPVRFGKTTVYFASVEDIIIHKMVAGRPRDLEDVKNILLKNKNWDKKLLKKWLKAWAKTLERPLWEQFERIFKG